MVAVIGFVIGIPCCAAIAQSLVQIVAFRLLQGFLRLQRSFRLAQVCFCSTSIRWKERGSAMALFGGVGHGGTGAGAR